MQVAPGDRAVEAARVGAAGRARGIEGGAAGDRTSTS
jgi:hypothetical protein